MVKNIYYRTTNFSNNKFSIIFQTDTLNILRKYRLEYNNLLKKREKIRNYCIAKINENIQGSLENDDKQKILNFSRDFYNNRGNLKAKYQKIVQILPSNLVYIFDSYFKCEKNISVIHDNIDRLVEEQYVYEKQIIMNNFYQNFDFVQNTKMIGQVLYQKMEKLLNTDIKNHNKKQRKMDIFLYNYFSRISTKASPFGLLGSTGVYGKDYRDLKKEIFMTVNTSIILKIFDKIYFDEKNLLQLKFKINDTLIHKEGKYYITVFNDIKGKSLYRNRQNLVTILESESLNLIIELMKDGKKLSGKELKKFLAQYNEDGNLKKLIEVGFFVPGEQLNFENNETLSEAMLKLLKRISVDEFSNKPIKIFERIVNLEKGKFSWVAYDKLVSEVNDIVHYYNIENFSEDKYVCIDKIISKNKHFIKKYADIIDQNQKVLNDLSRFIAIFDISVRNKYLVYEMLRLKYNGEFIPKDIKELSGFLREVSRIIFRRDGYWLESFGYLGNSYNQLIDNRLLELKKEIINRLSKKCSVEKSDVVISKHMMECSVAQLEKIVGQTHNSRSYFLQINSENKIVLNHIYKGYGIYRRRFNHYFAKDKEYYNLNGELIDIPIIFGFNANIRETTERSLLFPLGDMALANFLNYINLNDLGFRLSKVSKEVEIFEKKTKKILYPHFLGSLITIALPSLVAVFNAITLNDSIYFDFGELVLREKLKKNKRDFYIIPRIYFENNNCILSRKKWYFTCNDLHTILNNNDISIGQKWINTIEYFENNNLPLEFFIKDFFETYTQDSELLKTKPLYINFGSFLSFKAFINWVKKKDNLLIEETLPECISTNTDVVTEMIVETNDK